MTVRNDLDRAIAMAEAARGNYLLFSSDSEDQVAQQVFGDMAEDMKRHVMILESRRDYLDMHNQLNQAGGQQQNGGQQNGGQPQNGGQQKGNKKQGGQENSQ